MAKGNYIKAEDIYKETNGGLDIILAYYPEANERKSFKIRDEKTASTSLRQYKGIYFVTDFGNESKGMNAIDVVMQEEGIEFRDAILYINERFCNGNLSSAGSSIAKPIVKKNVENKTGSTILEFNENISTDELKFVGKNVTHEVAKRYNLRSLKYYITKKGTKDISNRNISNFMF